MPEISTGTPEGRWECRHRPPEGRCTRQDSPPPSAITIEGDAWRGALLLGRGVPSQAPQRGAASGETLLLPLPTLLRAMHGEAPYRCQLLGRGVPSQAPPRGRCTRQGSPPPNAVTIEGDAWRGALLLSAAGTRSTATGTPGGALHPARLPSSQRNHHGGRCMVRLPRGCSGVLYAA
jgi:hypothetical protein